MRLFSIVLCFFFLSISYAGQANEKEKDVISSRVVARWKTIVSHEFDKAYDYETPTYRAVFSRDLYVNRYGHSITWDLIDVQVVEYNNTSTVVTVMVKLKTMSMASNKTDMVDKNPVDVEIHEKWIKGKKGLWWHGFSE